MGHIRDCGLPGDDEADDALPARSRAGRGMLAWQGRAVASGGRGEREVADRADDAKLTVVEESGVPLAAVGFPAGFRLP